MTLSCWRGTRVKPRLYISYFDPQSTIVCAYIANESQKSKYRMREKGKVSHTTTCITCPNAVMINGSQPHADHVIGPPDASHAPMTLTFNYRL
jgi:hypothetical protein